MSIQAALPTFARPSHRAALAPLGVALAAALALAACGSGADGVPDDASGGGPTGTASTAPAEGDPTSAGTTPAAATSTGALPRADRIAAAIAGLERHAATIPTQGVAGPLVTTCDELLASGEKRLYVPYGDFGICLRDVHFIAQWNRADPQTKRPRANDHERFPDQFAAFVEVARALNERGIEFLVAPIPRPIQIYPERMIEGLEVPEDFVGADPGVTAFLRKLAANGVEVLHLTPHFAAQRFTDAPDEDAYLFHDWNNHWTPRGVNLTADLVAERVRQMEGFEPGPLVEGRDFFVERAQVVYPVPQPGDKPRQTEIWVDAIIDDANQRAHQRSATSPILLLGDSNSGWYNKQAAPLGDQLMARLGHHLDVIAISGSRADGVWDTLVRREGEGTLENKQIVIWVFEAAKLVEPELKAPVLFPD